MGKYNLFVKQFIYVGILLSKEMHSNYHTPKHLNEKEKKWSYYQQQQKKKKKCLFLPQNQHTNQIHTKRL